MPRIDDIFRSLRHTSGGGSGGGSGGRSGARSGGRGGLMPFITGGFPSPEVTAAVLPELQRAGASIVEIGFPFSDPIADGPVIASSMHEVLERGGTPRDIFDAVREVRSSISIGLVAMVSQSIVQRMGVDRFLGDAAGAGFDGLIVPDADLAEAGSLARAATSRGMTFSMLVAPTTSADRLGRIVQLCSGFVYLLARVGITGERGNFAAARLADRVAEVRALGRALGELPVAVGFGISTAEHVRAVVEVADAAIVGSALVRRMAEASDPVAAAGEFVRSLAAGLDGPG